MSRGAKPAKVLRYWLEALRAEDALLFRPRIHTPQRKTPKIDLKNPGVGQPYFRLGASHAEFLLLEQTKLITSLDPSALRFFEHSLREHHRREARPDQRPPPSWLVGWPTFRFRKREELAALFRFPVELSWLLDGELWTPQLGRVPNSILLTHEKPLPSMDLNLANQTLGIHDEQLNEQLERWSKESPSPLAMVRDVLLLLDPNATPDAAPSSLSGRALFDRFAAIAAQRVIPGVDAHPVGIVQDAGTHAPTYHLQRDLDGLLKDTPKKKTPLHFYLSGEHPRSGDWRPLMGRWRSHGLTTQQRLAAESGLGTTLTAVRGPPGTGKTELILNLAAHAVVHRAHRLERGRVMREELLVVTSTNNRAVDNVLDPLAANPERLSIGLRAGNQEVTKRETYAGLMRARSWLAQQTDQKAKERLQAALVSFREARSRWEAANEPERARQTRDGRRAMILNELGSIKIVEPLSRQEEQILEGAEPLLELLDELEEIADAGKRPTQRIMRRWGQRGAKALQKLTGVEPELGAQVSLPPSKRTLPVWKKALTHSRDILEARLSPLRKRAGAARDIGRKRALDAELRSLEASKDQKVVWEDIEASAYALFLRALDVREAWAVVHKLELIEAIDKAAAACAEFGSFRRAISKKGVRTRLLELFPVMGTTLLSFANVFDASYQAEWVVIDEAGQCHPAHAVSGLLRARRALVIGDVHQLPPVIQLSSSDEARVLRRAQLSDGVGLEPYRVGANFDSSAQTLAGRAALKTIELVDHFRCQPEIIGISDALCEYRLTVHTPRRTLVERVPFLSSPVLFGAVGGAQQSRYGSWRNEREAAVVRALVGRLLMKLDPQELAILTPYRAQLELLRYELQRAGVKLEGEGPGVAVGTVHRFQGGERSVVLFSTVITEPDSLRFLDAKAYLLNVAVSRAKDHLVVLGHGPTLYSGRNTQVLMKGAAALSLSE